MRTTVRYFITDHLGSTVALADSSGAIVSSTSYDSFGNAAPKQAAGSAASSAGKATPNIATSYRYTGREYDADTGLYYYRNRWYDPETGRFISEDPIGFAGGDINLYSYVGNNPHGYIDPFGFWRCAPTDPPSGWWDAVQGALDVAGLAPVVGIPADLVNAGISYTRGDYIDAGLSVSAAVPVAGTFTGLAKIARKAKKALGRAFSKARSVGKFADPKFAKQLERQLAKDGPKSVKKSLRTLEKRLAQHKKKLPSLKYKSSVEREIRTFKKQVDTAKQFLKRKGIK